MLQQRSGVLYGIPALYAQSPDIIEPLPNFDEFLEEFFTPASRKDAALCGSGYMDKWPNATMWDSPYVDRCATWQAEHGIYNEYNLLGLTHERMDVLFAHGGDYPRYMDALREDAKEDAERLRGMDLFMPKSPAIEFANKINPRMLCHNIIAVGRLYYEDYMAVTDDKMEDKLGFEYYRGHRRR